METFVSPALSPAAASVAAARHCLNCAAPVETRFCPHCGQDVHTHRLTMGHLLLHELPHSVWHVDKGVLYTLREMLLRPGVAIQQYLAGRRVQHYRPISYLLLAVALSVLLMSSLHIKMPAPTSIQLPKALLLAQDQFLQLLYRSPSVMYIALLPLNAFWAWLVLRISKYNFAEHLLAQAFITGTLTVLSLFSTLPLVVAAQHFPWVASYMMLSLLPTLLYPTYAYAALLASTGLTTTGRWVRALCTSVLQLSSLMLACVALLVYLLFGVLRTHPGLKQGLLKPSDKTPTTQAAPGQR